MQLEPPRRGHPSRRFILGASLTGLFLGAAAALGACGLSTQGTDSSDPFSVQGAAVDGGSATDGASTIEGGAVVIPEGGSTDGGAGADASDATTDGPVVPTCTQLAADAGIVGALDLSTFVIKGDAVYNDNGDGRLTLTDSSNSLKGAGWLPTVVPVLQAYDLTFAVRVGSGDTAGDGISFAVLQGTTVPGVGDNGDGIGLRNLPNTGYAVIVDMYKTSSDKTDDDVTTLKLVTMPGFNIVAHVGLSEALDDGNPHAVIVSWHGTTLSATLHGPTKMTSVSLTNPGFAQTSPAYLGFTGSTGGSADSHNEVASITVADACR